MIEISIFRPKYKVRIKDLNLLKFRETRSNEIGDISLDWLEGKSVDTCAEFLIVVLQRLSNKNTKVK